ncbi:hypothetical protein ABT255_17360 [Streptomyces mirabilis]|uniref:hypothetical protein n=1 Tax=Streptomyces mirabilis TaxID=68239 RepID=UPI00224FA673|nr:hypothetical protein [Streptomyces mirabilis]MCX4617952.1 hypothetical protein [Streptomyces mirabilis]
MTSLDRTPAGTEINARARLYAWLPVITTLATLATVLALALTGNGPAAMAAGVLGSAAGGVQITVNIRR